MTITQRGISKIYSRESEGYDSASRKWSIPRIRKEFLSHLSIGHGDEVLEVAVGTGLNMDHYPTGANYTGVDINESMLERARRRKDDLGIDVRLHIADAKHLPYADSTFDIAFVTHGLSAIPGHGKVVDEMFRVTKSGGIVGIMDFRYVNLFGSILCSGVVPFKLERVLEREDRIIYREDISEKTDPYLLGGQEIVVFRRH